VPTWTTSFNIAVRFHTTRYADCSAALLAFSLSWLQARAVFLRLVSAVEHSHAMGITHADLKPSQVLFAGDGSVRLSVG
jgi:serine/threonine protein kinase